MKNWIRIFFFFFTLIGGTAFFVYQVLNQFNNALNNLSASSFAIAKMPPTLFSDKTNKEQIPTSTPETIPISATSTDLKLSFIFPKKAMKVYIGCTYQLSFQSSSTIRLLETVLIDLGGGEITDGLSETCRKNLGVARKKGVQVDSYAASEMPRFVRLYRATMTRRTAVGYYDFEDRYFEDLARGLGEDIWVVIATNDGNDVAGALVLRHGPYLSYHLGGSDYALRSLCATNMLLVHIAERGRSMGLRAFHLGGGMKAGDSLFHFKAGFSSLRGHFHVGRKIYAQKEYRELTAARKTIGKLDENYFPAYRAPDRV